MPYGERFFLSKLEVEFKLQDGTVKTLQTRISEREIA